MKTVRNQGDLAALINRIKRVRGQEQPLWGKMTVKQMMSHLVQAADLPFRAILPDKSGFVSRTFIKPLILYVLPMPKEVKTSPEFNQQEKGRKPQEFSADRAIVIDAINDLGALPLDYECLSHPMFGKMNAKEWALIAQKHIDHHLKQFGV